MFIDSKLLDELTNRAKDSPRLRMHFDLRNTTEDSSQRMLNAIEPGSEEVIHRHTTTSETVVVLRGHSQEILYDENGIESQVVDLVPGSDIIAINVPKGQWHTCRAVISGTVLLTTKDGAMQG